ncbi:MAG: hypothetical protein IJA79_09055 [Desulfovibrio sp.]|nr:hypothetical protein [Desulfovibrio sp.]
MTEEAKEKSAEAAEATESQQPEEAEQLLPDGIGLTVEEVRAILQRDHKTVIPADDPALMYITIMNAALTEQAKLQKVHEKALGKLMGEYTNKHIEETKKGMTEVMSALSQLTTEGINKAVQDMVKFKQTMFICTAISFVSALLIVIVFILKGA